jgi:hypothetical protein
MSPDRNMTREDKENTEILPFSSHIKMDYYFFSFIHMHIQCLGHFSPFPPTPPFTPHPHPTSLPGRNHYALIFDFVEERV